MMEVDLEKKRIKKEQEQGKRRRKKKKCHSPILFQFIVSRPVR